MPRKGFIYFINKQYKQDCPAMKRLSLPLDTDSLTANYRLSTIGRVQLSQRFVTFVISRIRHYVCVNHT